MTITKIVGTDDGAARAAIAELVAIVQRGGEYSDELLERLPRGRVEVHVRDDTGTLAVIVLEDGAFTFQPLDAVDPGRVQ